VKTYEKYIGFPFRLSESLGDTSRKVPYSCRVVFSLTAKDAATLLGTTKPTVGKLIEKGVLRAERRARGSLFQWVIDDDSVRAHLAQHGRYDKVRTQRLSMKDLDERLDVLERGVSAHRRLDGSQESTDSRELRDARGRIVDLEEALTRSRISADLQRDADAARTDVITHLIAALAAAERADELRRRAHAELDEAVRGFSLPADLGELRDAWRTDLRS
jgi:excisionase family DNA binding protein